MIKIENKNNCQGQDRSLELFKRNNTDTHPSNLYFSYDSF